MESHQIQQIKSILEKYHQQYYQKRSLMVTFQNIDNINLNEFRNYRKNGELMLYIQPSIIYQNKKYIPGSYLVKHNNKFIYYFPGGNTFSIDGIIAIIGKYPINQKTINFLVFMVLHSGMVNDHSILTEIANEIQMLIGKNMVTEKNINYLVFQSI